MKYCSYGKKLKILFLIFFLLSGSQEGTGLYEKLLEEKTEFKVSGCDEAIIMVVNGKYILYEVNNDYIWKKGTGALSSVPSVSSSDAILCLDSTHFAYATSTSLFVFNLNSLSNPKKIILTSTGKKVLLSSPKNMSEDFFFLIESNQVRGFSFEGNVKGTINLRPFISTEDITSISFLDVDADLLVIGIFYKSSDTINYTLLNYILSTDTITQFNKSLNLGSIQTILQGDNLKTISIDKDFLLCSFKDKNVNCIQAQFVGDEFSAVGRVKSILSGCSDENLRYSMIKKEGKIFFFICINENNSSFKSATFEIDGAIDEVNLSLDFGGGGTFTDLTLFSAPSPYIIFFYSRESFPYFYVFESPNCSSIKIKIGSGSKAIMNFKGYMYAKGDSQIENIKVYDAEPNKNYVKYYCSDVDYTIGDACPLQSNFAYNIIGQETDTQTFLFLPVDAKGSGFKACELTFEIKGCNKACETCDNDSKDDEDTKCNTCKKQYCEVEGGKEGLCVDCTKDYKKGYYLDSEKKKFMKCGEGCLNCKDKDDCSECDKSNDYVLLKGASNNCILKSTVPDGYYVDKEKNEVMKCDSSCATCNAEVFCLTCTDVGKRANDQGVCETVECQESEYFYEEGGKKKCVSECPSQYAFVDPLSRQCFTSCPEKKVSYDGKCLAQCPEYYSPEENTNVCKETDECRVKEKLILDSIEEISKNVDGYVNEYCYKYHETSKHVETLLNFEGKYKIIIFKREDCGYSLGKDLVMLNLGSCVRKLREKYAIPETVPLITAKINIFRENITQIGYSFYNSIDCKVLDLNYCKNEKAIVKVPVNETKGADIEEAKKFNGLGVDVFDPNDPFFNDVCFEYTSDSGKDVVLKDRRKEFFQNVSFCEEGCKYKGVDYKSNEAICECNVKTSFITELLDNELTGDFLELINAANFEVLACYHHVFNFSYIKRNIGGWVITFLIAVQIVFLFMYIGKGVLPVRLYLLKYMRVCPPIKSKDYCISDSRDSSNDFEKINNQNVQMTLQEESPNTFLHKKKDKKRVNMILLEKKFDNDIDENSESQIKENSKNSSVSGEVANSPSIEIIKEKKEVMDDDKDRKGVKERKINRNVRKLHSKPEASNIKLQVESSSQDEEDFSDSELNCLEMQDAIVYDKRTFCSFYWQLVKERQDIINTFINIDVLDPFQIKAIYFFFSIGLYFTLNGLFYTEEEISEEYYTNGKIDFFTLFKYELSRCIYASMVGVMINFCISCLASSRSRIEMLIKRERDPNAFRRESLDAVKSMKIKNVVFLIFNFLFMLCFWYYISAFCNCYGNTQKMWLYGSLVTWGIFLVFPFFSCFLIASFRFLGMKCKSELLYNISTCLT